MVKLVPRVSIVSFLLVVQKHVVEIVSGISKGFFFCKKRSSKSEYN